MAEHLPGKCKILSPIPSTEKRERGKGRDTKKERGGERRRERKRQRKKEITEVTLLVYCFSLFSFILFHAHWASEVISV
jgi:hypothetical protein